MAQAQPENPAVQRNGQKDVIDFLADPKSYSKVDRVERFETHGNLVFLAGNEAWKIKRAVRLAYMDFSTLEKRHAACRREVEINRKFGSDLYLGCVPIARSPAGTLVFGGNGDIVEWAVRMRRFDQSALLSAIEVESAAVMQPDSGDEPDIFDEFRKTLPKKIQLKKLGRFEFYDAVKDPDTCLVIQTGEQRLYANLLLVIGAIAPR